VPPLQGPIRNLFSVTQHPKQRLILEVALVTPNVWIGVEAACAPARAEGIGMPMWRQPICVDASF